MLPIHENECGALDMSSRILPEEAYLTETMIYESLSSLQGTHVPYSFGCSSFTTPSQEEAYVLIFEQIKGIKIGNTSVTTSWESYQPVVEAFFESIQAINKLNVRHRTLDIQDNYNCLVYDTQNKWGVIKDFNYGINGFDTDLVEMEFEGIKDNMALFWALSAGNLWSGNIRLWMVEHKIPADRHVIYDEPVESDVEEEEVEE
ncbi:hypothetical protein BDN72DRAFT_834841 [Pluteus cervinus]|uniref:Uncharacterized protein n=1 Tax=Pluteus cervinus TaxID=181527 RepID=A0ACD3B6G8_9AGAR|nr:hypothetical protein BDN72DRAFT_834841 [Pluteus cervinus]